MKDDLLARLLAGFGSEEVASSAARRAAEDALLGRRDPRATLHALLTVRPPAPIEPAIATALDALLAAEAAARPRVDALTLPTLAETHRIRGGLGEQVALWRGDLITLQADAIVNAANAAMLGCFVPGHRCIDNAIHAAAGPALRADCAGYVQSLGGAPEATGRALLTPGHHLPARRVIHTVGPIVEDAPTVEHARLLASSYRSVLDLADQHGLDSVGLCSVSTGVFGYRKDAAARVVLDTIERWLQQHPDSPIRIVVSLFADVDVAAYETALRERAAA